MNDNLDVLFCEAVGAIDTGDIEGLGRLLACHPRLVHDRLDVPGPWLVDREALNGFFQRPFLLWFVAEDPVRKGRLPKNIADVARAIIHAAQREEAGNLEEQLDYALRLVCWSWIARECGVQIELIDVLVDAGASPDGRSVYQGRYGTHSESAIYNKNFAAAEHLLKRGAPLTFSTAVNLGRWSETEQLAETATLREKQDAFVQAAMNGQAEALRRLLALGMEPNSVSSQNQSHGTALHHAVWSGNLGAVKVLVEAGASLDRRDTIYDGTPGEWAEHGERESHDEARKQDYREIAAFLREKSDA